MNTNKNILTKREKRLLLALALVGVFAVMLMFVLLPLYNQLSEKTERYDAFLLEKAQIGASLAAEPAIRGNRDAAERRHGGLSEGLLRETSSSEIGRMLTELCTEHGLKPVEQRLSAPWDFTTDESEENGGSGDPAFLVVSAVMTVMGGYDDLKRLLDTVEQVGYLRVSLVSFSGEIDAISEPGRITVCFEVTMMRDGDELGIRN